MISKLALTLISSAMMSVAMAQAPAPAKPAAKPAAKHTVKHALRPTARKSVKPVKTVAAPAPLADATPEQLEAAKLAYLGNYDCEFKQSISIEPHDQKEGYVDVHWKKEVLTMKPVLSSTGALRLEDVTGRTLMIQIANKSMLLDVKAGQRLVDACVCPAQRELMARLAAERAAEAASGVIQADTGLGLEPSKN